MFELEHRKIQFEGSFAALDWQHICMVASIYRPFSVNALGGYLECCPRPNFFKVEIFDLKANTSSSINSHTYPSGNFSGLLLKASLMRFVSTPYNSATSESKITCWFRRVIILFSTSKMFVIVLNIFVFKIIAKMSHSYRQQRTATTGLSSICPS